MHIVKLALILPDGDFKSALCNVGGWFCSLVMRRNESKTSFNTKVQQTAFIFWTAFELGNTCLCDVIGTFLQPRDYRRRRILLHYSNSSINAFAVLF